ncbi:MAG: O-antigen ligase family protein [Anaerolineae bacterium]|nr:O-antigen ligase family protein [Anaerolineae bacterium]
MQLGTTQSNSRPLVWIGLAVGCGFLVAWLPVMASAGLIGGVALLLVVVLEPPLAVLLMLSLAPLKTLIATEAPLPLPLDIGQLSFALVIAAWAVWRVTRQRFTALPFTRLYWALAGIMLAFVPSLFGAESTTAWVSEILKWVEMGVLVLIVLDFGLPHHSISSPSGMVGEPDLCRGGFANPPWATLQSRPYKDLQGEFANDISGVEKGSQAFDASPTGRWQWIAFGVVLAAVLQALIGLYEYRGGSGAPHLWIDYVHFRAFGTFGQPNPFSAFMGLSLPLALGLAWGYAWQAFAQWQMDHRWSAWLVSGMLALMYAGFGLLLLAGLLVAWGRGAWLGFGAAAVMMVFFAFRQRWIGVVLITSGLVLGLALWSAGLLPATIQLRIDNTLNEFIGFRDVRGVPISDDNFAIVERLAHWQAAINMMNDHPFSGVGLGNYETVYFDYSVPSWPRPLGHAHNDYLNVLAETGLIGLVGYLAGWIAIGWWTLRALQQPDPVMRGMVLGLMGTWTHLAMHSVVDKLYVNNIFLHIGVMLGLLAVAFWHREYALVES